MAPNITTRAASKKIDVREQEYLKALVRCRAEHDFFFLDLPKSVRQQIYGLLFSGPPFPVCSFAKDGSLSARDPWPAAARAQVLCTSKAIYKEAVLHLYRHTNWVFSSSNALSYFTWHDVHPAKLGAVALVTLTNLDALRDFQKVSDHLIDLRELIIDCGGPNVRRRNPLPDHPNAHTHFAKRIKNMDFYKTDVQPHILDKIPPKCCVFVLVKMLCDMEDGGVTKEMVCVSVDRDEVYRNYRAVAEEDPLVQMEMPTAGDSDATDGEEE
jgi:hypothetical protein